MPKVKKIKMQNMSQQSSLGSIANLTVQMNRMVPTAASAVSALPKSKHKKSKKDKEKRMGLATVMESLEKLAASGNIGQPRQQQPTSSSAGTLAHKFKSLNNLKIPLAPTCREESPTVNAFIVRRQNGKLVRDVSVDTHDLLNEPGGYLINLFKHGETSALVKSLRIHLGIRKNRPEIIVQNTTDPTAVSEIVRPGTITPTDDYAREIFRGLRSHRELKVLYAILEVSERDDCFDQKTYLETGAPNFLFQFISTIPTRLSKFHLEMPGMSGVYLPEWKFLLDQQTSLEELICNVGVVMWNFYERSVRKNSRTLKKIVLRRLQTFDASKSSYTPMDWAIFSDCSSLAYLKLTCGYKLYQRQPSTASLPPYSVFLHENLDSLPRHSSFMELHLGKVWVEPCQLQKFSAERPFLRLCLDCNDQEYYEDDLQSSPTPLVEKEEKPTEHRLFSVSRLDITASMPGVLSFQEFRRRGQNKQESFSSVATGSTQKRYGCIVMSLFASILLALAMLFIIILFRHLRKANNNGHYADGTDFNLTVTRDGSKVNISLTRPNLIWHGDGENT